MIFPSTVFSGSQKFFPPKKGHNPFPNLSNQNPHYLAYIGDETLPKRLGGGKSKIIFRKLFGNLGVSWGFPWGFLGISFWFLSQSWWYILLQIFIFESTVIYLKEDNKEENSFKRPGWLFLSFLNMLLHHLQMNRDENHIRLSLSNPSEPWLEIMVYFSWRKNQHVMCSNTAPQMPGFWGEVPAEPNPPPPPGVVQVTHFGSIPPT